MNLLRQDGCGKWCCLQTRTHPAPRNPVAAVVSWAEATRPNRDAIGNPHRYSKLSVGHSVEVACRSRWNRSWRLAHRLVTHTQPVRLQRPWTRRPSRRPPAASWTARWPGHPASACRHLRGDRGPGSPVICARMRMPSGAKFTLSPRRCTSSPSSRSSRRCLPSSWPAARRARGSHAPRLRGRLLRGTPRSAVGTGTRQPRWRGMTVQ